MYLHTKFLTTTLEQEVECKATCNVAAIRLNLQIFHNPTGSLLVEIRNDNGLVAQSESIDIATITSELNFHGMVRFYINAHLQKNQTYKIRLTSTGYTFSDLAFVGWLTDFDFNTYPKNPTPQHLLLNPFDYEVWVWSNK